MGPSTAPVHAQTRPPARQLPVQVGSGVFRRRTCRYYVHQRSFSREQSSQDSLIPDDARLQLSALALSHVCRSPTCPLPSRPSLRLVVDGNWTYSADHPTIKDWDNINNVLDVVAPLDPESSEKLLRYLSPVSGSNGLSLVPWASNGSSLVPWCSSVTIIFLDRIRRAAS